VPRPASRRGKAWHARILDRPRGLQARSSVLAFRNVCRAGFAGRGTPSAP